jgi:hypothetical protein
MVHTMMTKYLINKIYLNQKSPLILLLRLNSSEEKEGTSLLIVISGV